MRVGSRPSHPIKSFLRKALILEFEPILSYWTIIPVAVALAVAVVVAVAVAVPEACRICQES